MYQWRKNACMILFTLNTTVMSIGTMTLILAYYTSIPIKFRDLGFIFLERTILIILVATPIIRFALGIPMV